MKQNAAHVRNMCTAFDFSLSKFPWFGSFFLSILVGSVLLGVSFMGLAFEVLSSLLLQPATTEVVSHRTKASIRNLDVGMAVRRN